MHKSEQCGWGIEVVKGDRIRVAAGKMAKMKFLPGMRFSVKIYGARHVAQSRDGELCWDDGTVWTRAPHHEHKVTLLTGQWAHSSGGTVCIQQDGDSFVIVNEAGPKVTTMKFMVGAGEQQVTGQDGTPTIATPLWDGCVLQMTLKRLDGTKLPAVRRRLVDGQLVLESVSSKGETVRRYFSRRVVETAGSLSSNATASDDTGSTVSVTSADTVGTSCTEEHARPDFSGRWLLEEIEGDCELLLIDAGAPWALRKLAKGMKYGLGRATQDIRHEGDAFVVVSEGGPRVTTQNFRAGAGEQQVMMPDGSMVVGTPQWQDGRLLMAMKELDGTRLASVDRGLVGGRMVVDSVTSKGELVRRVFVKQ
mmetsp:Transcript_26058/g.73292  ORF Transcript_26058/g.73292 Transcript_26058/m.73292 type:complete len:364 (+) Transcript_26058:370-1461(+)